MTFQTQVAGWLKACFGDHTVATTKLERARRFGEEAVELMQAAELPREDAHALVEWVYNRPVGEFHQEVGGTMVTLAAMVNTWGESIEACQWKELTRCWANIDRIRAKNHAKAANSALPGGAPTLAAHPIASAIMAGQPVGRPICPKCKSADNVRLVSQTQDEYSYVCSCSAEPPSFAPGLMLCKMCEECPVPAGMQECTACHRGLESAGWDLYLDDNTNNPHVMAGWILLPLETQAKYVQRVREIAASA